MRSPPTHASRPANARPERPSERASERPGERPGERLASPGDSDPRDGAGAEVIDLATRNVLPSVTQRRPRSEGLGLAAGVALVALLGGVTLWTMDKARSGAASSALSPAAGAEAAPAVPAEAITPGALQPGTAPGEQAPGQVPGQVQAPAALDAPPPSALLQTSPAAELAGNRFSSPTIVYDGAAPEAVSAPGAPEGAAVAAPGAGADDFAGRLGGVGGAAATATAMVDPTTTVTQGTLIPAVLETAIDTDVPGFTRAVVSADVRSFDGSRILVPRSSRLIGQYKSGLQAGQKRAYVIWTRLIRPDGVSVNLGSPAITFAGETGLPGRVDSHFFERFGSAMLLSVIGGLSTIGGGATALIAGGGQSAAATAVGQTGQIAPTIRVRQGEPIRVFTARDLDFSRVTAR